MVCGSRRALGAEHEETFGEATMAAYAVDKRLQLCFQNYGERWGMEALFHVDRRWDRTTRVVGRAYIVPPPFIGWSVRCTSLTTGCGLQCGRRS